MTERRAGLAACVLAVLLLGLALVTGRMAHSAAAPEAPRVTDAWVRLPVVAGRPGAAYMTIYGGARADRLVSAQSPVAERVELHRTTQQNGVMRMERVDALPIPAGQPLRLAPGGLHLMLFGLKAKQGEPLPITLTLASGRTIPVTARTVAATQQGAHQH